MTKHSHKISIALTDHEFDRVSRYAGKVLEKSVVCRDLIMMSLDAIDAELNSRARAAGYRLVPIEASEVSEV